MEQRRSSALSDRERACLRLVAQFRTSKEIAAELGLSAYTVDSYLAEAMRKLGVSRRTDAARLLVEEEKRTPERFVPEPPPVERGAPDAVRIDPEPAEVAASTGRRVRLGIGTRLAIIVGGAIGLIVAAALLTLAIEVLHRYLRHLPDPVFHTR